VEVAVCSQTQLYGQRLLACFVRAALLKFFWRAFEAATDATSDCALDSYARFVM
jgi:hypothetical protein